MSKEELKNYYLWFQKIIPERLEILSSAIRMTHGFERWKQDYTPESLIQLGEWLACHVKKRFFSGDLTIRSYSLAFDSAMYFGETLIKHYPELHWHHFIDTRKDNADFGQSVIKGKYDEPCNVIRLLVSFCFSLVRKKKTGADLKKLFELWANILVKNLYPASKNP